jgi:hypothetical protein
MSKTRKRMVWVAAGLAFAVVALLVWLTHRGVVVSASHPIPECQGRSLAPEIAALIRPVLGASQRSDWGPNYDALEALLVDKSPRGLEARVALSAYYLGSHPSEELAESLLTQERDATPLMQTYMQCRPQLEREWLIGTIRAGRGGYEAYFEELKESRQTTK